MLHPWRRAGARVVSIIVGTFLVVGCGDPDAAGDQADAEPTTSGTQIASEPGQATGSDQADAEPTTQASPAAVSSEQALTLLDRVAVTERFVGLDQLEPGDDDDDLGDGNVCDRAVPSAEERLATQMRIFATEALPPDEAFAEVHQQTTVYRSADAASDALTQIFDELEDCERNESRGGGQVIEGYQRAPVHKDVSLDARAVAATMTVERTGNEFAFRYGCMQHDAVLQCVSVYAITESANKRWFKKALVATSRDLTESVAAP